MKKKFLYTIFSISFVFIIIGLALNFVENGFMTRGLVDSLSSSTYGKIHFISTTKHGHSGSDAILVESQGKTCLIDAANPPTWGNYSYPDEDGDKVARYLKSMGVDHLDCIIATHNHSDHIGGMVQVANNGLVNSNTTYYYRTYQVTNDDTNNPSWDNRGYYDKAINAMNSKGVHLVNVHNNTNVNISIGNFNIKLLNTESWANRGHSESIPGDNNNSIVEYVTIGSNKALLAADMEKIDEDRLVGNGSIGKVDILKMGHHGAATSTSKNFLNTVNPSTVIVTGSPELNKTERNMSALVRMKDDGKKIYYTSKVNNAIVVNFNSSGSGYTVNDADGGNISKAEPVLNISRTGNWTKVGIENNKTVWYMLDSDLQPYGGWTQDNGNSYYLHLTTGAMLTGWREDSGKWYYLNESDGNNYPEGAMVKGWAKASDNNYYYLNPSTGAMETGWQQINGTWYYLNENKTDEYPTGAMVKGWFKVGDKWYYFNNDGAMQKGWQEITYDGVKKWYYFKESNPEGAMLTGWQELTYNGVKKWYYFVPTATTGHPTGSMATNICLNTDQGAYCFDEKGGYTDSTGNIATIPVASEYCKTGLKYNGSSQTLTKDHGVGYSFSGNSQKNAGTHTVTAVLKDNYHWSDNSTSNKTFKCSISKIDPSVSGFDSSFTVLQGNSKDVKVKANTSGTFAISVNNSNISLNTNSISVSANTEKTFKTTGTDIGTSKITLKFTPSDTTNYNSVTNSINVNINQNSDSGGGDQPVDPDAKYTLTVNPNGGVWNNKTTNSTYSLKNKEVINIANPTREGHTFKNWTISNVSTTMSGTSLTMGTGNTTITAQWQKHSYTVVYNSNGGTGTMSNSTGYYNTSFNLTANKFTRTNYKFSGWSLTPNGNVAYKDGATVYNLTLENNKTVTLYAKWIPNNYTIKYNANGGTGTMSDSSLPSNGAGKLAKCTFTREGYKFVGWSTEADGNVIYTDEDLVNGNNSSDVVTLYAIWLEDSLSTETYTIKFDSNGGTGGMQDMVVYQHASVVLRENAFTRSGYTFVGWALEPEGTVIYTDGQAVNSITTESSITLYAIWTNSTKLLHITYDSNGGTGEMEDTNVYEGTDVQLRTNSFKRDGYEFVGWSTTPDGEISYSDEAIVTMASSTEGTSVMKLYAVWVDKSSGDTTIENVPDTFKLSQKISIVISILLVVSGLGIFMKYMKKETN